MSSEALAAWVQAIGSIAAIVAATRIASRQSREAASREQEIDERQRASESKFAYLLSRRLASILIDIEFRVTPVMTAVAQLPELAPQLIEDAESVVRAMLLRVAWDEAIFNRFDVLPTKAAEVTAHLLYSVARYDRETRMILEFSASHPSEIPGSLEKLRELLSGNLGKIQTDLNNAETLLAPLIIGPTI